MKCLNFFFLILQALIAANTSWL